MGSWEGSVGVLIGLVGYCSAHHRYWSFQLFWSFCRSGGLPFIYIDIMSEGIQC